MSAPADILVVDDTPANVKLVGDLLAVKGYAVTTAADGQRALELLRARKFDLVLLDVMMPGPDGFEVCERLRADGATRDIPVIFLTEEHSPLPRAAIEAAEPEAIFTKPVDLLSLRHAVLMALGRRR